MEHIYATHQPSFHSCLLHVQLRNSYIVAFNVVARLVAEGRVRLLFQKYYYWVPLLVWKFYWIRTAKKNLLYF